MENNTMPYSYHTFMYPFYYGLNSEKKGLDCVKEMRTAIENGTDGRWRIRKLEDTIPDNSPEAATLDDQLLDYASYQYFMPKARNLVFADSGNTESSLIIRKYLYNMSKDCESYMDFYLDNKWYRLNVNQIRLELVEKLSIGILIFETENYGLKGVDRSHFEDKLCELSQSERLLEITKLNDLGRRIFSPYLQMDDKRLHKANTAVDRVILSDSSDSQSLTIINNEVGEQVKLDQDLSGFRRLIFGQDSDNNINLKPAIDDRMFVISCMGAESLTAPEDLPEDYETDGIDLKKSRDVSNHKKDARMLYHIVFLEGENNLSCYDDKMMQQKLDDHVYTRWIDFPYGGTIHGVTEYSMVCITSADQGRLAFGAKYGVINPFLTEYTEMAKIALLQRAEIIHLEAVVSKVTRDIEPGKADDGDLNKREAKIQDVQDIWKQYILFQNELLLPEVTFQEQGVEIYDMLKVSLRIEKLNNYLDNELDNLHEMAEFEDAEIRRMRDEEENQSDNRLSRAVNLFSIMGISLALASAMQDALSNAGLYENKKEVNGIFIIIEYALLLTANLLILCVMNRDSKHKISNNEKKKNHDMLKYNLISIVLWGVTIAIIMINAFC